MAVAAPAYAAFSLRYPELVAKVPEPLYNAYFAEAGLYLSNTDSSIVADVGARTMLLNMLVAHIAALNIARADPTSFAAGALLSATEGSVNVTLNAVAFPGSAAWFAQSTFGLQFYAATAQYRTARYIPAQPAYVDPYAPLGQGFGGGWRWGQ